MQIRTEPIKQTVQKLQSAWSFLGEPAVKPRKDGIQIVFRFDSEFPPSIRLRLKVEANTREHFTVSGLQPFPFAVKSSWFNGHCNLTTYTLEELLGTTLRALYQRRKGRDLYDLFIALTHKPDLNNETLLHCYRAYMKYAVENPPSQKQYIQNMEAKMKDPEFLGDITALLSPDVPYSPLTAYELVRTQLIEKI